MRAMILKEQKKPLVLENIPTPIPKNDEILIKVSVCGVCRTDLHVIDGDLKKPNLPLILGHEIVGVVEEVGIDVKRFKRGERVGVPWLGETCGSCSYCQEGDENLCDKAQFTGYNKNGGFAEYTTCKAEYAIHLPKTLPDLEMAPLLCAGLIGYRSYRIAAPQKRIGFYGFGAAAEILIQVAQFQRIEVYAFTRPGDKKTQDYARKLGAVWAGDSTALPPKPLDSCIIFAPVGDLVPLSLKALKKGGRCVCGGIHMTAIPSFPYSDLWGEKSIQSVANLTRQDARDFFELTSKFPIKTEVTAYPLEKANEAINDFREGKIRGVAVLKI